MACTRCRIRPILDTAGRGIGAAEHQAIRRIDMDQDKDTVLEHPVRSTGMFLAVGDPPEGYDRPRICSLCGCVYYPKV